MSSNRRLFAKQVQKERLQAHRVLDGKRQDSGKWFDHRNKLFLEIKCVEWQADSSVYELHKGSVFVLLFVYVDDTNLSGSHIGIIECVADLFKRIFEICVTNNLYDDFHIMICNIGSTMKIHNSPLVERLFRIYRMKNCKPATALPPRSIDMSRNNLRVVSPATHFALPVWS